MSAAYPSIDLSPRNYTVPKVKPRFFDQMLAGKARRSFGQEADAAGTAYYNQGKAGLQRAGLGRSGSILGLLPGAANARNQTLERLNLPFELAQQDFTEGARQFDTGTAQRNQGLNEDALQSRQRMAFALRDLFFRNKWNEDAQPGWMDILGSLIGTGAQVGSAYAGRPR